MTKYIIDYKNNQIGGKDLDYYYYLLFANITRSKSNLVC